MVYCDNNPSIKLSENPVMHGRSKHIDVRFHFLRDLTKDGIMELKHYNSQHETFCKLRAKLGVIDGLDKHTLL